MIKTWIEQYCADNIDSLVSPYIIWDAAKAVLWGQLISYSSAKKKTFTKLNEQLIAELSNMESIHKSCPTKENLIKLNKIRSSLNVMQTNQTKKLLFFTKQKYYEYGNKPSKLLAYQLRKEQAERTIKCIRNKSGELSYDTKTINTSFLEFYKQLYSSESPSKEEINQFLDKIPNYPKFLTLTRLN